MRRETKEQIKEALGYMGLVAAGFVAVCMLILLLLTADAFGMPM